MAKKTPAEIKAEYENLKEIFARAKLRSLNCALILSDDGVIFETDPKLPSDKLWLAARKQKGATTKGVTGKLDISGVELIINCAEEPPGNFELKLKQYLTQIGLKFRPVLVLPAADGAKSSEKPDLATDGARPSASPSGPTPETAEASQSAATDSPDGAISKTDTDGISDERRKTRAAAMLSLERQVDALLATL